MNRELEEILTIRTRGSTDNGECEREGVRV
jgi:hypothetical protein